MKIKSSNGSSLVESLYTLGLATTLLMGGFSVSSLSIAKMWLEHSLYEGLLCELSAKRNCEQEVKRKADFLGWGYLQQVRTSSRLNSRQIKTANGQIVWCNRRRGAQCNQKEALNIQLSINERNLAGLQ